MTANSESEPAASAGAPSPPMAPATAEEEEIWRAAVGRNAAYYLDRWRRMDARGSMIAWNWPACLVNLFWFAYRKMWAPMIAVLAALVALGALGAVPGAGAIAWLLTIGLSFLTGGFGNHLYRRQTARLIAEASALDRAGQIEALKARGGVSARALAVSLTLAGLVIVMILLGALAARQGQVA